MSHHEFDDRVRSFGAFSTRRDAVGLLGGLLGGLGLAAGDRGTLGKKKEKCKKENQLNCGVNSTKLSDEKGCWHCCPAGSDIVCKKGNCCKSAVAHCCPNSPVCRANVAVPSLRIDATPRQPCGLPSRRLAWLVWLRLGSPRRWNHLGGKRVHYLAGYRLAEQEATGRPERRPGSGRRAFRRRQREPAGASAGERASRLPRDAGAGRGRR